MTRRGFHPASPFLATGLVLALASPAVQALPSFAAQTGQQCAACHVGGNFPELTPWGRYFKLSGYTIGRSFWADGRLDHLPGGVFGQAGATWVKQAKDAAGDTLVPNNGDFKAEEGTVYVAGKVTDYAGVFLEYTWGNDYPGWTGGSDIMDARAVAPLTLGGRELLLGVDVNDGPSLQDAWNTVPAWTFPYYTSPTAPGPVASALINGLANNVAGTGVYAWWDRKIYAEVSLYRTARDVWRFMSSGIEWTQPGGAVYVDGYNPYWRLNYSDQSGPNAWMVGTFGMITKVYPDNTQPSGPTDKYDDYGFDAQYQYLTDLNKYTLRATWLYEKEHWDASYPAGDTANPDGHISQILVSATWWRNDLWGLSGSYFQSDGSSDADLYGLTNANGDLVGDSPNTNGYVLEADYLVTQNIKLSAQYVGYFRYNGSTSNTDGLGRAAGDNDTLFLNLFVAY